MEEKDYANVLELRGAREQRRRAAPPPEQNDRIFRLAVLTLGLLCVLQGALNVCLRLSFPSHQEETHLPSVMEPCGNISCCRLLHRENLQLKEHRDQLLLRIKELTGGVEGSAYGYY